MNKYIIKYKDSVDFDYYQEVFADNSELAIKQFWGSQIYNLDSEVNNFKENEIKITDIKLEKKYSNESYRIHLLKKEQQFLNDMVKNFDHWYKKDGVVYCYDRKMSRDVVVKTVPNKKHGTLTKVSWIKI